MTHEVGYDKGYMQAEKDYFDRTEKDRQASYDAGYEIGKAEGKAEHDKECDRCILGLRKEIVEKHDEELKKCFADKIKAHMAKYCRGRLDQQYTAMEVIDYIGFLLGESNYAVDVEAELKAKSEQEAAMIDRLTQLDQAHRDMIEDLLSLPKERMYGIDYIRYMDLKRVIEKRG